jgi:ATP-dependent DNA helicase PIF1
MLSLSKDQIHAVEAVNAYRCVFITGPAGTGKSVLIRHLYGETFAGRTVHLLSSTGISAYNIRGMTVHSFISRIRYLKEAHPLWINLKREDVIIVDEVSMMGRQILDELSDALQMVHRTTGQAFGGHQIVFVGDFAQLPPVDDAFCFQSRYWRYVDYEVHLSEIKRQEDRDFAEFLLRVRSGQLTTADRKRLQAMTERTPVDDAIHLYPTNDRARKHNELKLHKKSKETGNPVHVFPSVVEHYETDQKDEDSFFSAHKARLYQTFEVCVGSRVMLTANVDVEEGWMNGTIAEVIEITGEMIRLQRGEDTRWISKENYFRMKIRRCMKCSKFDCEEHASTTLYLDVGEYDLDKKHSYMKVCQFPLLLSWGMTIHKSQGLTLPNCVIHLYGDRYTPSLFYVAISRCTKEDTVVIRASEGIRFDQICPEEVVMKKVFSLKEKECQVCAEPFVGPYKLCQDCCSCPAPFERLAFTAFSKKLTKEMEEFVVQVLEHPVGKDQRMKKFRKYLTTLYKV